MLFWILEGLLTIAFLLCSPILLWQALNVRKRAFLLPEPDGPKAGVLGEGETLRLLVLGDSAGAGVGSPKQDLALCGQLAKHLATDWRVEWQVWAESGFSTQDTLDALREREAENFDIVVISLGVNDVTSWIFAPRWLGLQKQLVNEIQQVLKPSQISLSTMPPMHKFPLLPQPLRFLLGTKAKLYTKILKAGFSGESGVRIADLELPFELSMMAMDGFHPGPPIYELWAEQVYKSLTFGRDYPS